MNNLLESPGIPSGLAVLPCFWILNDYLQGHLAGRKDFVLSFEMKAIATRILLVTRAIYMSAFEQP